jgi:hypothetical protein
MTKNRTNKIIIYIITAIIALISVSILTPNKAGAVITKSAAQSEIKKFKNKCNDSAKYKNTQNGCKAIVSSLKQNPPGCGEINVARIQNYINQCEQKINKMGATPGQAQGGGGGGSTPATDSSADPALDCIKNRDKCDLVKKYINPIIGFLSAAVAIAVTIGIISGGIRYAGAGDDPQKMNAAKRQITGAIVALLAYIFLYLILQWLAPGI